MVDIAPLIFRKYFENCILQNRKLKAYLEEKRHILLHFYDERPCCFLNCISFKRRGKVMSKEQFQLIFSHNNSKKQNVHDIFSKGYLTQCCFCVYEVNQNVGFHILDITLSMLILKNCEKTKFNLVENWMTVLQRSRNELAHLSDFK